MAKPINHREKILQYLAMLKVKMTEDDLDAFLKKASPIQVGVSELLARFLESPALASQASAIAGRIGRANFPTAATMESFDWNHNRKTIRPDRFLELATGEFIRRKENLTFVGSSGLGKTHLMEGIGKKCCAWGYRVRYETSASLLETLNKARAVRALPQKVKFYCSYDFLIIDEFGFEKLERKEVSEAMSLLYKVIDGRNRRNSTGIITNVSFENWSDYLGDPPMTMALLDRVVDQTNIIRFEGVSIRQPKKSKDG